MKSIGWAILLMLALLFLAACQTAPKSAQSSLGQSSSTIGITENTGMRGPSQATSGPSGSSEQSIGKETNEAAHGTGSSESNTSGKTKVTAPSASTQTGSSSKSTVATPFPPGKSTESNPTSSTRNEDTNEPTILDETVPSEPGVTMESKPPATVTPMRQGYLNDLLAGVNVHRQTKLSLDTGLCSMAQAHAEKMARERKLYHECSGVESVGNGGYEDGYKQGSMLTVHCPDLADEALVRIGVGAARDRDGSIYVCILGKMF